jgi:hypothetical protein
VERVRDGLQIATLTPGLTLSARMEFIETLTGEKAFKRGREEAEQEAKTNKATQPDEDLNYDERSDEA